MEVKPIMTRKLRRRPNDPVPIPDKRRKPAPDIHLRQALVTFSSLRRLNPLLIHLVQYTWFLSYRKSSYLIGIQGSAILLLESSLATAFSGGFIESSYLGRYFVLEVQPGLNTHLQIQGQLKISCALIFSPVK